MGSNKKLKNTSVHCQRRNQRRTTCPHVDLCHVIKSQDEDKLPLPVAHNWHCSPGHRCNDCVPKDVLHLFQREVSAILLNHSRCPSTRHMQYIRHFKASVHWTILTSRQVQNTAHTKTNKGGINPQSLKSISPSFNTACHFPLVVIKCNLLHQRGHLGRQSCRPGSISPAALEQMFHGGGGHHLRLQQQLSCRN